MSAAAASDDRARVDVSDEKKKPTSPFASLAALKTALPEGPARAEEAAAPAERAPAPEPFAGKIVVRRTRKGRGGKTVTTITGLRGDAAALDRIARELRTALGCGAACEDGAIALQGEQTDRARAWLEARGAKRVVIGS